jgi:hypothetical protein
MGCLKLSQLQGKLKLMFGVSGYSQCLLLETLQNK